MTWYLTLRPDAAYSHPTPTAPLLAFLAAQPELRQSGPMAFESAPGQPSLHLVLACCRPDGSYTCEGTHFLYSNGSSNIDRSFERLPGGAAGNQTDTNDNLADFAAVQPSTPQSLASPAAP